MPIVIDERKIAIPDHMSIGVTPVTSEGDANVVVGACTLGTISFGNFAVVGKRSYESK